MANATRLEWHRETRPIHQALTAKSEGERLALVARLCVRARGDLFGSNATPLESFEPSILEGLISEEQLAELVALAARLDDEYLDLSESADGSLTPEVRRAMDHARLAAAYVCWAKASNETGPKCFRAVCDSTYEIAKGTSLGVSYVVSLMA